MSLQGVAVCYKTEQGNYYPIQDANGKTLIFGSESSATKYLSGHTLVYDGFIGRTVSRLSIYEEDYGPIHFIKVDISKVD